MKRYTRKSLEVDVASLNRKLEKAGCELRLLVGARYGYTAIDSYLPQVFAECGGVQNTVECGTPRECLTAAQQFVLARI